MAERISVDIPAEISFEQMKHWAQQFDHCCIFNSHADVYQNSYPGGTHYDWMIAAQSLIAVTGETIEELRQLYTLQKDWIFGALSYDLKNTIEAVDSRNFDGLKHPNIAFFVPKYLLVSIDGKRKLLISDITDAAVLKDILEYTVKETESFVANLKPRIDKETYIEQVEKFKAHIQRGDIYEANFCQEFFQENVVADLFPVYQKLSKISATPFGAFMRFDSWQLAGASPERYIQKKGNTLVSQPIKGTAKRGATSEEDRLSVTHLTQSVKENAENVMIVDLVRNDLSRTAVKNSVEVTDLCGIYAFPQVYQMISTIQSEISNSTDVFDVIQSSFPMGSMTGAPKISAMNICEDLESFKRGWYSGSVGYVSPDGDADFNVVIRSVNYNANKKYLSYAVGGAITILADPNEEYEECILKAKAIQQVLG